MYANASAANGIVAAAHRVGEPRREREGGRRERQRHEQRDRAAASDEPADAPGFLSADEDRDQADVRDVHPEPRRGRRDERELRGERDDAVGRLAEPVRHDDLSGERRCGADPEPDDVLAGLADDHALVRAALPRAGGRGLELSGSGGLAALLRQIRIHGGPVWRLLRAPGAQRWAALPAARSIRST
jgi:hypothetical protein